MRSYLIGVLVLGVVLVLSSCGDDSTSTFEGEEGSLEGPETEAEAYVAATFTDPTTIDNGFLPLEPGIQFVLEGSTIDDDERLDHVIITTVTDLTKVIDGVETVVIWDRDFSDGELVETELAFFAQDDDGNVWRMGEYPEEYEDGELVEAPAWLAGLEDAVAGIAMMAEPQPGTPSYSQGWGPEVDFIDRGVVNRLGEGTCVPVDCYVDVLVVDEYNVEEVGAFQTKWFERGVGNVRVGWRGDPGDQEELELARWLKLGSNAMDEVRAAALELEASAYDESEVYGETAPLQ